MSARPPHSDTLSLEGTILETIELSRPPEYQQPIPNSQPFSYVLERILRALRKRDNKVPGIEVEFPVKAGRSITPRPTLIKGDDFKLQLYGVHTSLNIPGKQLDFYSDKPGPILYIQVGGDSSQDTKVFMDTFKVTSGKEDGNVIYLEYRGECHCNGYSERHAHRGYYGSELQRVNSLNRDSKFDEGEPTSYRTEFVMKEFEDWLEQVLLPRIEG